VDAPPGRVAGAVQWPFVGLSVLLVLLILTTPGLLRFGAPGGASAATSAVLIVDRPPGANATHFYLEGLASTRYSHLALAAVALARWPVPPTGANVTFRNWTNATDSLNVDLISSADPLAVNVSAQLVDANGVVTTYYGVYAFNITGASVLLESLSPGLDPGTTSLLVTNLPEPLPLLEVSSPA
jgi:hypothetical protein